MSALPARAPLVRSTAPRFGLEGRVVTMDPNDTVLDRGVVYVDAGRIAAVAPTGSPPPDGFAGAPVIASGGTIFPGLIELHNHLSYNVIPQWLVPRRYTNRDQWSGAPEKRRLISGPMTVLGQTPSYVEAVVRYVEAKCLLGGVTTSQGLTLASKAGIARYYRGTVRNVEQTDDPALPEALTRIPDVEAADIAKFLARLERSTCLLLHLSEGTDPRARAAFSALRLPDGRWAITPALAGIHGVALTPTDLETLAANGGALVWSPLSNLLLYGATADVAAAKAHGLRLALGSDWSPSGSKNLLGELKVARLVNDALGGPFSDRDLVAMATRNPAAILGWHDALGSIEPAKRADLLVVAGRRGDPYASLLEARETAITLVIIDGVPRYGQRRLMERFGPGTEPWRVGRADRLLNLAQDDADPVVGALTLAQARDRLVDGLGRLPELAEDLERPRTRAEADAAAPPWTLLLDEDEPPGVALRPRFAEGPSWLAARSLPPAADRAVPLSELLVPLTLDPPTVADDPRFFDRLAQQPNLPDHVKQRLPDLY